MYFLNCITLFKKDNFLERKYLYLLAEFTTTLIRLPPFKVKNLELMLIFFRGKPCQTDLELKLTQPSQQTTRVILMIRFVFLNKLRICIILCI